MEEGDDESHQLSANRSVSSVIAAAAGPGLNANIGGAVADAAMSHDDDVSNHVLLVLVVCSN